jgi:hypothetical protein
MRKARSSAPLWIGLAVVVVVAGCGSSGASTSTTAKTPTANQASVKQPAVAHLSIVSPHAGAHTGSTLTVHVAATGAPSASSGQFRYVLDGRVVRSGSSKLTFHHLAPGRHSVRVVVVGNPQETSTTFIVRAPAPAPKPVVTEPVETQPTATTPPPPVTTAPPAEATPPAENIPQGANAGDGDGDNQGQPSDGDGNL